MVSNDSGFLEAVVGSAPNLRGSVPAPRCSGPQTGGLEGGFDGWDWKWWWRALGACQHCRQVTVLICHCFLCCEPILYQSMQGRTSLIYDVFGAVSLQKQFDAGFAGNSQAFCSTSQTQSFCGRLAIVVPVFGMLLRATQFVSCVCSMQMHINNIVSIVYGCIWATSCSKIAPTWNTRRKEAYMSTTYWMTLITVVPDGMHPTCQRRRRCRDRDNEAWCCSSMARSGTT